MSILFALKNIVFVISFFVFEANKLTVFTFSVEKTHPKSTLAQISFESKLIVFSLKVTSWTKCRIHYNIFAAASIFDWLWKVSPFEKVEVEADDEKRQSLILGSKVVAAKSVYGGNDPVTIVEILGVPVLITCTSL